MHPEFSSVMELNENIISEYPTAHHSVPHHLPDGEEGVLIITNKRVLFFKQLPLIRKLFKGNSNQFELDFAIYLPQIMDLSHSGIIEKFLSINGRRFYLDGVDFRKITQLIKETAKTAVYQNQVVQPQNQFPNATKNIGINKNIIYCAQCGRENTIDGRYCIGCGKELNK